jgi:hypothetical protein
MLCAGLTRLLSSVGECARLRGLTQFLKTMVSAIRKPLIPKRRDVRVVEGARLKIALAICDGVLRISITVAKPAT